MRERRAHITNGDHHGRAVIAFAADGNAFARHRRHPAVQGFRRTGNAAGSHHDAHFGSAVDELAVTAALNADHAVGSFIKVHFDDRHAVMHFNLARFDFFFEHVNVIAPFEGILTMRANIRVARIRLKMMGSKAVVFEPVKGFARMLREAVDGFLQGHVFAVGDDVVGKGFPVVLDLRIGFLHA